MKKIKSSLELALEKARKMGDEKESSREMPEEQYLRAARVIAQSFLDGKLDKEKARDGLERHPEHCRGASKETFIQEIAEGMDLHNTLQVLEAIEFLSGDEKTRENCARAREIHKKYRQELEEQETTLKEQAEHFLRRKYAREGIKGSALAGFNVQKHEQWKETFKHLNEEYRSALQPFFGALRDGS